MRTKRFWIAVLATIIAIAVFVCERNPDIISGYEIQQNLWYYVAGFASMMWFIVTMNPPDVIEKKKKSQQKSKKEPVAKMAHES